MGVRVLAGERTGYAYSDDLSPEKIRKAARVAARIAHGPSSIVRTGFEEARKHNLYPMLQAPHETGLAERVDLVKRADRGRPRLRPARVPSAGPVRRQRARSAGGVKRRPLELRSPADGEDGRRGAGSRGISG